MSVQVEVENSHSFSEKAPEEAKKQNKPFKSDALWQISLITLR